MALKVHQTYFLYGLPKAKSKGAEANPYKYGGKELTTDMSNAFYDFEARVLGLFNRPDPKAGEFTRLNTYSYCGADPVNKVDFDGMQEWPIQNIVINGVILERKHQNNFHEEREDRDGRKRQHQGLDMNIGSGDQDRGAPVFATHDGIITRIVRSEDGNPGGIRIQITSSDKKGSTFYMHLESTT